MRKFKINRYLILIIILINLCVDDNSKLFNPIS